MIESAKKKKSALLEGNVTQINLVKIISSFLSLSSSQESSNWKGFQGHHGGEL